MTKGKDLTGFRFGKLLVIRPTEKRAGSSIVWECKCDCGNVTFAPTGKLTANRKRSCGCLRHEVGRNKSQDITGYKSGRLTAIRPTDKREGGSVVWECRCDCGKIIFVSVNRLKSGNVKSCGCLKREYTEKNTRNVEGLKFGKLTAICPTDKRDCGRSVIWQWKCDCGNVVEKSLHVVSSGLVVSCGCFHEEKIKDIYLSKLKPNYVVGTNLKMLRKSEDELRSDNQSGVRGVYFLPKENRYVAAIVLKGVRVHKRYWTLEEAKEARRKMKQIHEEFLEWWESLSEEEKAEACKEYENEKATQAALLKKKIREML